MGQKDAEASEGLLSRFVVLYRFQCSQEHWIAGDSGGGNARTACGGLAQLGERLLCKQEVSGSSPLISTNLGR